MYKFRSISNAKNQDGELLPDTEGLTKFGRFLRSTAIGNNRLRGELIQKLLDCGHIVPVLLHPRAYIRRTAKIRARTVIEPKAIVNADAVIGNSCTISTGAIVDHDVEIKECCHINVGAVVKAGGRIDSFRKLQSRETVRDMSRSLLSL